MLITEDDLINIQEKIEKYEVKLREGHLSSTEIRYYNSQKMRLQIDFLYKKHISSEFKNKIKGAKNE